MSEQTTEPPVLAIRFWALVDRSGDCWLWLGGRTSAGYGLTAGSLTDRREYAHRIAYNLAHGAFPPDKLVLHRCDNPACFNPEHLFLGTQLDNLADCEAKGRRRGPQGIAHPRARLSDSIVADIRRLRRNGFTGNEIKRALNLDVCQQQITAIARGESWRHLESQ